MRRVKIFNQMFFKDLEKDINEFLDQLENDYNYDAYNIKITYSVTPLQINSKYTAMYTAMIDYVLEDKTYQVEQAYSGTL